MAELEKQSTFEEKARKLEKILKRIFFGTSFVIIEGEWKSGKTDFALWLCEVLLYLGLIQKVASNIRTWGDERFKHITSMEGLEKWLWEDKQEKLFIFDEVSEKMLARKSMYRESVHFWEVLPQISKAHARIIVIFHSEESMDKLMFDRTFLKGTFIKYGDQYRTEQRKTAKLFSRLFHEPKTIRRIPKTSVGFDPDEKYAMTMLGEGSSMDDLSFEGKYKFMFECARDFAEVSNFAVVAKQKGVKPMTVKREVAKYIRWSLQRLIEERKDKGNNEGLA